MANTENKGIRFPNELISKIESIAEKEYRTFSQEVIYLCEEGIRSYEKMERIRQELERTDLDKTLQQLQQENIQNDKNAKKKGLA